MAAAVEGLPVAGNMNVVVVIAPTVNGFLRETLREALSRHFPGGRSACDCCEVRPGESEESFAARVRGRVGEGCDLVVAAGGDGTVAAVAHLLVGGSVPLGIVPMGTGNLVARELGIPIDVEAAVALLARGPRVRRIDAMRIGGRTFLLNAGVGINAEVIDETSRLGKSLFGRSAYVGTAVWKVLQARPQRIEVTIDGAARVFHATDVAISNCGILAKALNPNGPDIRADDGQIDVGILCMKTPLDYPWYYLLRWIAPRRVNRIMNEFVARTRVSIRCDAPIVVQADGDIVGTTPVDIEVLPSALAVAVP